MPEPEPSPQETAVICSVCRKGIGSTKDLVIRGSAVMHPQCADAGRTRPDALWQFLEGHRGELVCTQCLAAVLGATGRIDRAVMEAEGRGAQRRYGQCSMCGKDRLVCGLSAS
jgi:hypothetical protein